MENCQCFASITTSFLTQLRNPTSVRVYICTAHASWEGTCTSYEIACFPTDSLRFPRIPTQAPLVVYHSGGEPAALEPFAEHVDAWEWTLATYLGAGVGACYRGNELFVGRHTCMGDDVMAIPPPSPPSLSLRCHIVMCDPFSAPRYLPRTY